MFYTIQNHNVLIAYKEEALTRFYDNVQPLPEDYEEGKYIVVSKEEEVEVTDYDENGEVIGTHTEIRIYETLELNPNYEEEQKQKEKERIAMLKLTRGDVFRGLLQAKGVTRSYIRDMIEKMPSETTEEHFIKEMALIDFDEALDFYRGNQLIDTLGLQLGITSEQLDEFFKTNDYKVLMNE